MQTESSPIALIERLRRAINQHDLDALIACFDPDYRSEFPAHPDRTFRGHEQMLKNWTQIFSAVPDIEAALLRCTSEEDTVWAEWEWKGTRADDAPFAMRGVTVQGVRQGRITWARMYMEPVEIGAGSDAAVRQSLDR
ncbi:MAG: nuclear transport factor 2 family protein [Rubrobacteraceae bacterium]|nr:nuclear transport factor 2 family protein [Rubrobacter sp.]